MIEAGRLDERVTFYRRAVVTPRAGNERGAFAPLVTLWAEFLPERGRETLQAGRAVDVRAGILRVRDSDTARGITSADRVRIRGIDHRIATVALPTRRSGIIEMTVEASLQS